MPTSSVTPSSNRPRGAGRDNHAFKPSPCSAELISTAYQPWNNVFLSQQNSHSRLISQKTVCRTGPIRMAEASRGSKRNALTQYCNGIKEDDCSRVYRFQIWLPSGVSRKLTSHDPIEEIYRFLIS